MIECSQRSSIQADFPSKEIQFELNKQNSISKQLQLNNKNYPRLPAKSLGNFTFVILDLSRNNISEIHFDCFNGIKVEEINLDVNGLSDLDFIQNLPNLKKLKLNSNKIIFLNSSTFSTNKQLTELIVSNNQIKKIDAETFKSSFELKVLRLSGNLLSSIESGTFSNTKKLTHLYLGENEKLKADLSEFLKGLNNLEEWLSLEKMEIEYISGGSFTNLNKLRNLEINNNRLRMIKKGMFTGLTYLLSLDLDNNKITDIDIDSFKENTNLKMLSLRSNNVKSINRGSFNGLGRITHLDLGYQNIKYLESNCFQGLDNLNSLVLKSNKIYKISSRAFEGLKQLFELELDLNKLTTIESEAFFGLKFLDRLKLNKMNVIHLNERSFFGMEKLVLLDLNDNLIQNIPNRTFIGLFKLKLMNLSNNLLDSIELYGFYGLESVNCIDLSLNILSYLEPFRFNSLVNLQTLIISENIIKELSENALHGLEGLKVFNLSANRLEFIKKHYFLKLSALVTLDLSRNGILSIEQGSFINLKQLTSLDVSYNCLFRVQVDLFGNLYSLKSLNLSMNMIKLLSLESLRSQYQLEHLIISTNLIEHFNVISYEYLPKLRFIDISHNSLLKTFYFNTRLASVNLNGNRQINLTISTESYTELKAFYTNSLNMASLNKINFSQLPNLISLDLGFINLTDFLGIFKSLNSNLKILALPGSIINSDLGFLNNFKLLIELDLSCVQGVSWQNRVILGDLLELQVLIMRGLNLNALFLEKYLLLDKYENLILLDLSNNSLEYFNVNLRDMRNLKSINLANNKLKVFDFENIPWQFKSLDLSFNQLPCLNYSDEHYFPYSVISFSNNNISEIDKYFMHLFLESYYLDLSNNQLKEINKNYKIFYQDYNINLRYLNLSSNSLKYIGNIFTNHITNSENVPIISLDLSNNHFEIFNLSFVNLVYLQYVYLQKNKISYLEENIFSPLKLLLLLDISNNRLMLIKENTFLDLPTLKYLNISSNLLKSVYPRQFLSLVNLIDLDMSNNSIDQIVSQTFSYLTNLQNFFIHLNPIKTINKLDGLYAIKNIYLDSDLIIKDMLNVVNLRDSIQIQLYKNTSRGIIYLKSVNVITYTRNVTNDDLDDYCRASMFLIKYNISLNLKTDQDFNNFFSNCKQFAAENMFTESSFSSHF
jgi:Leucine-rich repeat (LRR) protein